MKRESFEAVIALIVSWVVSFAAIEVSGEVNPFSRALAAHHFAVSAVHNHMLFETPRLFFLHFVAYGELDAGCRPAGCAGQDEPGEVRANPPFPKSLQQPQFP